MRVVFWSRAVGGCACAGRRACLGAACCESRLPSPAARRPCARAGWRAAALHGAGAVPGGRSRRHHSAFLGALRSVIRHRRAPRGRPVKPLGTAVLAERGQRPASWCALTRRARGSARITQRLSAECSVEVAWAAVAAMAAALAVPTACKPRGNCCCRCSTVRWPNVGKANGRAELAAEVVAARRQDHGKGRESGVAIAASTPTAPAASSAFAADGHARRQRSETKGVPNAGEARARGRRANLQAHSARAAGGTAAQWVRGGADRCWEGADWRCRVTRGPKVEGRSSHVRPCGAAKDLVLRLRSAIRDVARVLKATRRPRGLQPLQRVTCRRDRTGRATGRRYGESRRRSWMQRGTSWCNLAGSVLRAAPTVATCRHHGWRLGTLWNRRRQLRHGEGGLTRTPTTVTAATMRTTMTVRMMAAREAKALGAGPSTPPCSLRGARQSS